jgi:DNA-binding response OmpR family regulator
VGWHRQRIAGESCIVLIGQDKTKSVRLLYVDIYCEKRNVRVAKDWESGLSLAYRENPNILLLDAAAPEIDGLGAPGQLRTRSGDVPILVLTAGGLDGSIGERSPFGWDAVMDDPSRVLGLLASGKSVRGGLTKGRMKRFSFGEVKVDFRSLEVAKGGQPVALSPREFEILRYMIENRRRVISRSELLERVWGYHAKCHTRTIDSHIFNLRQKIEKEASKPVYIHTVHRIGYRFTG